MSYFGVDKFNVGSFEIAEKHDIQKLLQNENIKINNHGEKMAIYDENTGEKLEFQCLTITGDEKFNNFHVGLKVANYKNKKIYKKYCKLELYVENEEGTKNLKPLTHKEVINKQQEIIDYLKLKYGLNIYLEGSKYTYLEINKTIKMQEEIDEYYWVLDYIKLVAPAKYKIKESKTTGHNTYTMIIIGNNSIKIKLYDKSNQLKAKGVEVKENYLRVELCLVDSKKIKKVFGTAEIQQINDKMMWEYFIKIIKEDLFNKIEIQLKNSQKELKKELKLQQKEDKKKYPKNFIISICSLMYKDTKIPLILDVMQGYEVLKPVVSRWDRTIKTIQKEVDKRPHKKNNLTKYNEIVSKINNK